jgi:hypothetical protein
MKRKLWLIVMIVGGFSVLSFQYAAAATEYIDLIVNVRVSSLYPGVLPSVSCEVSNRSGGGGFGIGFARIPVTNGSYSGNVRVRVTLSDVFTARRERGEIALSDLRYHTCKLWVTQEGRANRRAPHTRSPDGWARADAKAPFTPVLTGIHRPTGR